MLRGVIGAALKKIACPFPGRQCEECVLAARCVFWQVFRTPIPQGMRLGGNFAPHPFVISPGGFGKREYEIGERLTFWLTLVGGAVPLLPYFIAAAQLAGERGLGKERVPFGIAAVRGLSRDGLWTDVWPMDKLRQAPALTWRDLVGGIRARAESAAIELITPMRLQADGRVVRRLDFPLLVETLARRVDVLVRTHCGEGEAGGAEETQNDNDARNGGRDWRLSEEIVKATGQVQWRQVEARWVQRRHWSARQGREIQLGGMLGRIELEGPLQPLLPLLRVGELLHVGKNTSYGYGWYGLEVEGRT